MFETIRISYLSEPPMMPDDADFGITIDFKRGESDPVKVFEAMADIFTAFGQLDRLTLGAVDPSIQPVMVLEDVEAASITGWVKSKIESIDDQALKEFDLKQQFGKYAVKAKYRVLEYLDKREQVLQRRRLEQLQSDLRLLAEQSGIPTRYFDQSIPLRDLVVPLDSIQAAKKLLGHGERLVIRSDGAEYQVNLSSTDKPSDVLKPDEKNTSTGRMKMVLLVRKPDYLGNSLWEFRHGETRLSAHIKDENWLTKFRLGEELVVPGSALDCIVQYEYKYDDRGELLSATHDVIEVLAVLSPPSSPPRLIE